MTDGREASLVLEIESVLRREFDATVERILAQSERRALVTSAALTIELRQAEARATDLEAELEKQRQAADELAESGAEWKASAEEEVDQQPYMSRAMIGLQILRQDLKREGGDRDGERRKVPAPHTIGTESPSTAGERLASAGLAEARYCEDELTSRAEERASMAEACAAELKESLEIAKWDSMSHPNPRPYTRSP